MIFIAFVDTAVELVRGNELPRKSMSVSWLWLYVLFTCLWLCVVSLVCEVARVVKDVFYLFLKCIVWFERTEAGSKDIAAFTEFIHFKQSTKPMLKIGYNKMFVSVLPALKRF